MTIDDDDRPGDSTEKPPAARQPGRRRLRTVAGVAGLAALLGSGAFLVTTWATDKDEAAVQEIQARTPLEPVSGSAAAPASAEVEKKSGAEKGRDAAKAKPEQDAEHKPAEQRVKEAREAAAKDGVKIVYPVVPEGDPERQDVAAAAKVTTTGSAKKGGTMRVITAHGDLTGQRELAWVAGGITKHGDVKCSQTVRLANEAKPEKRPNLLVCWRTSERRSVITVATDLDGRPSAQKSKSVITREWEKLG